MSASNGKSHRRPSGSRDLSSNRTIVTGKDRLIKRATMLNQAWVVLWAWAGRLPPSGEYVRIPAYADWRRRAIQQQISQLEDDIKPFLPLVLGSKHTRTHEERFLAFASSNYERLMDANSPFCLCTIYEFERKVGPIRAAKELDAPPYTEILMQGFRGVAYRHPEYMLARDVECLHELFWQSEDFVRGNIRKQIQPPWMGDGVQNVQTLGRATVLACFGLLESFASGLARGHLLMHPDIDGLKRKQLERSHGPLLERLTTIPSLIREQPLPVAIDEPPLLRLFGDIKQFRDAFVHCEPGEHEARSGFVKQARFHDVTAELVDDTVRLTSETIRIIWRWFNDTDKDPAWLRFCGTRNRVGLGFSLAPLGEAQSESAGRIVR